MDDSQLHVPRPGLPADELDALRDVVAPPARMTDEELLERIRAIVRQELARHHEKER